MPNLDKFVEKQDRIDLGLKFGNYCVFSFQPFQNFLDFEDNDFEYNFYHKMEGQFPFGYTLAEEALMHLKSLMVVQIDFK